MPTIPKIKNVTKAYSSVGIIENIFLDNPDGMFDNAPDVTATTESIRSVGNYILGYAPRRNSFVKALINRIGMVRLNYMIFTNPWAWCKQGLLEMGETVEQIWIDLAKAFPYNPKKSQTRFLQMEEPNVKSAFHSVNYRAVYKITVSNKQLRQAFLSVDGLVNFIEEIIGSLARSANVDEFMVFKYTIALGLLDGFIKNQQIPTITNENVNDVVTTITEQTALFQFPSTKWNFAGVSNTTPIENLMIIETANASARIKVNSLAAAYNIDYVKFMGNVVQVDSFGEFDWDRMNDLFAEDPSYKRFTQEEINALSSVQIVAMDRKFPQIYDNLAEMATPHINGEGLFENYFYHVWKVLGLSPFHNAIAYSTSEGTVTSVSISPTTASASKGQFVQFAGSAITEGLTSSQVTFSIQTTGVNENTAITTGGQLYISAQETLTTIKVRATSVADNTKFAEATVTVV